MTSYTKELYIVLGVIIGITVSACAGLWLAALYITGGF